MLEIGTGSGQPISLIHYFAVSGLSILIVGS